MRHLIKSTWPPIRGATNEGSTPTFRKLPHSERRHSRTILNSRHIRVAELSSLKLAIFPIGILSTRTRHSLFNPGVKNLKIISLIWPSFTMTKLKKYQLYSKNNVLM